MTQPPGRPQGWWQPPGAGQGPPAGSQQPLGVTPHYGGAFRSQYGGLGAFEDPPTQRAPKRGGRRFRPLLAGALTIAVGGGAVAAWLLGAFQGDVLDQDSLQNGVTTVLRDNFGEHDVTNARCPDDQPVRNGTTFDCTVDIAGARKTVSLRVLNEKPEFEVGAPK